MRIGTAEIYAEVERIPEILEAVAIGQEVGHDTRIVLFVRLAPGVDFDAAFEKRLRAAIRSGASPRHVPEIIVPVAACVIKLLCGCLGNIAVDGGICGGPSCAISLNNLARRNFLTA